MLLALLSDAAQKAETTSDLGESSDSSSKQVVRISELRKHDVVSLECVVKRRTIQVRVKVHKVAKSKLCQASKTPNFAVAKALLVIPAKF